MNENGYYTTSDLALAAAISIWFPLDCIDKTNPTKAQFIFRKDDGLEEIIEIFWKRGLKVEPQAYFGQLKVIKSRLYGND